MRTPHIHIDITGRQDRMTTQLYFPGEPLNANDILLRNTEAKHTAIARAAPAIADDPSALAFSWDIVLPIG